MTKTLARRSGVGLLIVAFVLPIVGVFSYELWVDRIAREELLLLRERLRIGMTRAEVLDRLSGVSKANLRLFELGRDEMQIQTPFRFGAGNWDLWLVFTDGRLAVIQVRTADGRYSRPSNGPPDIIGH